MTSPSLTPNDQLKALVAQLCGISGAASSAQEATLASVKAEFRQLARHFTSQRYSADIPTTYEKIAQEAGSLSRLLSEDSPDHEWQAGIGASFASLSWMLDQRIVAPKP